MERLTRLNDRRRSETELSFLEEMLFEAFFWDPTGVRPALETFRNQPEFVKQLGGWGRHGDRCVFAIKDGMRVGAAWFRLWTPETHSYGFVDPGTPEVGIGVRREFRGEGVGRRLLGQLTEVAREDGCPALSLSVSPGNRARRLYESMGFRKVGEAGTSWTMLLDLAPAGGATSG